MANENLSPLQFEVARRVTKPFIMIETEGVPAYIRFDSEIAPDESTFSERVRSARKNADGSVPIAEPMHLADVTDLQSGEEGRLVLHSVLENTLKEAYPNDGYVGKLFEIRKTKRSGKRYFSFDVTEIRLKSQSSEAKPSAKK